MPRLIFSQLRGFAAVLWFKAREKVAHSSDIYECDQGQYQIIKSPKANVSRNCTIQHTPPQYSFIKTFSSHDFVCHVTVWKIAEMKYSVHVNKGWNNPYIKNRGKKPLFWGQWFRSRKCTLKDATGYWILLILLKLIRKKCHLEGRDHMKIRNCLEALLSIGHEKNVFLWLLLFFFQGL